MDGNSLIHALEYLFPDARPLIDFIVQDNSDGNDPFISEWNLPDPQPSQIQLDKAWLDWQAGADERLWVEIRVKQSKKLRGSDWTQISDVPITIEKKSEWIAYRQELRDIPQDFPNPNDVVWPIEPD